MSEHLPFRLTPQSTDLSCWQWVPQPRPEHQHLLIDQNGAGLARIMHRDGTWTADTINEAYLWTRELDLEPVYDTGPYFTDPWESNSISQLKERLERDLAYAAILYPAVPDPMTVPAVFVLGHTVPCSAFLEQLELHCRNMHGPDYSNGTLATLTGDPQHQPPPNPVVQARFLAAAFDVPKGGWPPRVMHALDDAIHMHAKAGAAYVDITRAGAATPTGLARSATPDPA